MLTGGAARLDREYRAATVIGAAEQAFPLPLAELLLQRVQRPESLKQNSRPLCTAFLLQLSVFICSFWGLR